VAAVERFGAGAECIAVERPRPVEHTSALEGIRRLTRLQPVAVEAADRVTARVEAVACGVAREHAHVVGEQSVQRRSRRLLPRVARYLPQRVHAGIGTAGDRQSNVRAEDLPQRRLELALDRAQPRLTRPAGEAAAVVLEQ
jgi:hypothetical protein